MNGLVSRLLDVLRKYAQAAKKEHKLGIDNQLFSKTVLKHLTKLEGKNEKQRQTT